MRSSRSGGSVGATALRGRYSGADLCGWLAWVAGLQADPIPCRPADLVPGFDWARVRTADRVVTWTGGEGLRAEA